MDDLIFQLNVEAECDIEHDLDGLQLSGRVVCDSRKVQPGDIFVAVKGPVADGHDYIDQVVATGAAIVIYELDIDTPLAESVLFLKVFSSASSLGRLAQASYGNPGKKLKIFGVTGTNGKTTVASMLKWILLQNDILCGFIGTIGYDTGCGMVPLDNTTPGSLDIAAMTRAMVDNGLEAVVMECSSHGLHQRRTEGLYYTSAGFTNLTGDHLDYHGTMEHYRNSKAIIFENIDMDGCAVINIDDPVGYFYVTVASGNNIITYGIGNQNARLSAKINSMDVKGSDITLSYENQIIDVRLPVPAEHNVANFLAAAGMALGGGITLDQIASTISNFPGVPGRLASVNCGQDFAVLVDYAHTDDALEHALASVKKLTKGKVILVFGCGGDRDRSKRPRMASVAQKYADLVILTNDNPRTEDPSQIASDIIAGFTSADSYIKELDRKLAIERAIGMAAENDTVLIAGKGHEDYQIIGTEKTHFDDTETARDAINNSIG